MMDDGWCGVKCCEWEKERNKRGTVELYMMEQAYGS